MALFFSNRSTAGGQRGFAMIAILSLITMVSAYLIASALNRTYAELSITREQRTMNALLKAKAALIAYAASEQWQAYKGQTTSQPGALPCPDQDDDGDGDCVGSNASSQIGRLPWKTLGAEDLRDASGERLWYALSHNFRKLSGASATIINSDTQGQFTVTGTAIANNVVAVVLAPGQAIQGQERLTGHNSPSSYFEGFNQNDNVNYIFTTNALPSDTFNDRLVVITQADLMSAVEPAVSARIERNIKPYLQSYFNQWGAFPFPAKFDNPSPGTSGAGTTRPQSTYSGDTTQSSGLLSITAFSSTPTPYPWSNGSVNKVGGTGRVDNDSCTTVSLPGWRCIFRARGDGSNDQISNLRVQVRGQIGANAGLSFANLPGTSNVVTTIDGSSSVFLSPSISGSLASDGVGTVTYVATLPISCINCSDATVRVTIPDVTVSTLTSASDANAGWFIANEWYRQTYYAVSPGYLPGGGGSCVTRPWPPAAPISPSCLMVNNLSPAYAVANDKRVVLVLAGRSLNGSARPSSLVGDYLEGANGTLATTPYVFENRPGVPTSINDRVVVVSP